MAEKDESASSGMSKSPTVEQANPAVDEESEAKDGYVLDVSKYQDGTVKTAADGRTVLIPQPSDSPDDPLNWPRAKKLTVLIVITTIAFLPDYGSAVGIPALVPQSIQWGLDPNTVQKNLVAQLVTLGCGAITTVALSNYFGRLPILFYFQIIALATGIWNAAATTFPSYLAGRAINGFFSIVAQAGGLMWIKDMFFFHEHPRMINIWSGGVIVSPYLSPLVEAFITWKAHWAWGFLTYSILNVVGLVVIIVFAEETWYNRAVSPSQQPVKRSHFKRLLGMEQWRGMRQNGPTFVQAVARPFIAISKIPVLLSVVYYFINFAWVIGVNATTSVWMTTIYGFDGKALGLFYIAGILGSILGELAGHWMHDGVGHFFMRRNNGRIDPEVRLYLAYLASLLMMVGLIVLGFALQNIWHYMIVAVFYGVQVAGIMITTTAVNAYLLDSYPEGSGEMGAWIVFGRVFGGFMATFIEINWVLQAGAIKVFGIQAGITVAAMLIIVFLQVFGKRIRRAQGTMTFSH